MHQLKFITVQLERKKMQSAIIYHSATREENNAVSYNIL